DDLQDFGSCGLLLQRLAQFVEQARVLDGDDGLGGKIFNQLNLLVGERAYLQPIYDKNAKRCIFLEQWDCEHGSQAIFRIEGFKWFIAVGRLCCDIRNMNYLFGPDCSRNSGPTVNAIRARIQLSQRSNQFGRLIVSRDWAKQVAITETERAEFRMANTDCIRQHRLKNGFELAGRTANDLENLRGRRLPLQRLCKLLASLGEFAPAFFELVSQIGGRPLHSITSSAVASSD